MNRRVRAKSSARRPIASAADPKPGKFQHAVGIIGRGRKALAQDDRRAGHEDDRIRAGAADIGGDDEIAFRGGRDHAASRSQKGRNSERGWKTLPPCTAR